MDATLGLYPRKDPRGSKEQMDFQLKGTLIFRFWLTGYRATKDEQGTQCQG